MFSTPDNNNNTHKLKDKTRIASFRFKSENGKLLLHSRPQQEEPKLESERQTQESEVQNRQQSKLRRLL